MGIRTENGWLTGEGAKRVLILLAVVAVFAIGLTLRFAVVQETDIPRQMKPGGDTTEYYSYAYNVVNYGIYSKQWPGINEELVPDAKRNPGYPLFLTLFLKDSSKTFNSIVKPVAITQGIISAVTILLALGLFRGFLSWPWGLGAATLVAISPHLIAVNVNVLTETLFTFFLVLFLVAIRGLAGRRSSGLALLAGIAFGAALLVRPTMQYFLIFLLPAFFVFFKWRDAVRLGAVLLVGFSLCYGPWIARNIISLDSSSKSILAAKSVQKGMYPGLMYNNNPETYGFPNHYDPQYDKLQDMGSVLKEVFRRVRGEPFRYLEWYVVGKPSMFLSWDIIVGSGDIFIYPATTSPYHSPGVFQFTYKIMRYLHWPLVIFSLMCSIFVWSGRAHLLLGERALIVSRVASLILAYFILVHMAGLSLPRYAIPIKPIIYGMAFLGLQLGFGSVCRYFKAGRTA